MFFRALINNIPNILSCISITWSINIEKVHTMTAVVVVYRRIASNPASAERSFVHLHGQVSVNDFGE
jgi:hypothetical protein